MCKDKVFYPLKEHFLEFKMKMRVWVIGCFFFVAGCGVPLKPVKLTANEEADMRQKIAVEINRHIAFQAFLQLGLSAKIKSAEIFGPYNSSTDSSVGTTNYCVKAVVAENLGFERVAWALVRVGEYANGGSSRRLTQLLANDSGSQPYGCNTINPHPFPELIATREQIRAKQLERSSAAGHSAPAQQE